MKRWIFIFAIISFNLHGLTSSQESSIRRYGDRCSRTAPCDLEARLSCTDEYCRCSRDNEIFDYVRDRCAVKEGERCTSPKFDFGEYNPCVSNAFCSETGICVCSSHSYSDDRGRCQSKKFYNDTCTDSRECDDLKYLSCMEGQCGCKLSSYDEYFQICRRKVGDGCLRSRDCMKNADCIESKCVCKKDFSETSAKTCGLSYSMPCGRPGDDTCSDVYFACVNGACRCKNPSYEVFDNSSQTCLSLVGGLCHLFLSSKNRQPLRLKGCVRNAECVRRELSPLSQCECAEGFVETVAGYCRLPHKAACEGSAVESDSIKCIEPLVCRNRRCECENENDVYDADDKICKRIIGSICKKDSECIGNSKCETGRCRCGVGFLPNFRGTCDQEVQSALSSDLSISKVLPSQTYAVEGSYRGGGSPSPDSGSHGIKTPAFPISYY